MTDNTVRTPAAQVYEQIESDLAQALSMLPATYDADNYQRATTGAAHALLAKTYLLPAGAGRIV